jgi:hypothetical protein
MGRKNVEVWIPARINCALRAAVGWAEDHDIGMEKALALCALIVIGAAELGASLLGRLVHRRRAIVALELALAIPVVALAYRSHPGVRTTNALGRGVNESVEENARMTNWKRSVEQALAKAEAKDEARQRDAATAEGGVDAIKASNIAAQEGETTRIDPGAARAPAKKQAETLDASNENGAAETKAGSAASAAKEAIAANDAKRADTKRANEPFFDSSPTVGGQEEQTARASRLNSWSRRAEIYRATRETDEAEVARKNAIARHAMTYSWVTTDGTGRSWVHTRPIYYGQRD